MTDAKPNGFDRWCFGFEVFLFLFLYNFFFKNVEHFAVNLDTKITSNYRNQEPLVEAGVLLVTQRS